MQKIPTFDEVMKMKMVNIKKNNIIPFRDLPTEKLFHMYNVESLITKNGKTAYHAEFKSEDDKHYKAWLPDSVIKTFNDLDVAECYIANAGLKNKENKNRKYFDTHLIPIKSTNDDSEILKDSETSDSSQDEFDNEYIEPIKSLKTSKKRKQ